MKRRRFARLVSRLVEAFSLVSFSGYMKVFRF